MRSFKWLFLLTLCVVLVGLTVGAAAAQGPLPPGATEKVIHQNRYSTLTAYGSVKGADKAQIAAALLQGPGIGPLSTWDRYYSASGKTNWNGSYVQTYYNNTHIHDNNADCGGWCISGTVNGTTTTWWAGCNPSCYSTQIDLAEGWNYNGLAVSVSIPPSIGFSGGGSSVRFDSGWIYTAGKYWSLHEVYSGVYGKSYIQLWDEDDSASGSHLLGNTIVTAIANGHGCIAPACQ